MKGNIESQLAEDFYNNVGADFKSKVSNSINSIELKAGVPLVTKDSNRYSNAVVYSVSKGEHRTAVTVVSDYGNKMMFPCIEDLFQHYNIAPFYINTLKDSKELGIEDEVVDKYFCLRERLQRQIELLTNALEGLNHGEQ